MKVLIIRFSSIGDIVLTSPIVRCVKNAYPNAEIHFVTKTAFGGLVASNPHIHKVHLLQGDIQPLILDLLKEKFDVVIDLHKNLRSKYVHSMLKQAFNSKINYYTFQKLNVKKWLYTQFKINMLPDKSIVERYFEGVKKLGVTNDGKGLDFFIPESDEIKKEDIPMSHILGFVACSIGGQHATKKMPVTQWKQLCQTIKHPIILLGGKEDVENAEAIKSIDPIKIYNACGKFNLNESAHIIKKSKLVISHDTGLMHIAAAFQKPVISIWGNTTPALGMFPYYGNNNISTHVSPLLQVIQVNGLSCRPCSKIGYATCPKNHFNCMNKIEVAVIVAKAHQILEIKNG